MDACFDAITNRGMKCTRFSFKLHGPAALQSCNPAPSLGLQVHSTGDWWEASPDSAFMRMAERALQKEWGVEPLLVREGEWRRCCCRSQLPRTSCFWLLLPGASTANPPPISAPGPHPTHPGPLQVAPCLWLARFRKCWEPPRCCCPWGRPATAPTWPTNASAALIWCAAKMWLKTCWWRWARRLEPRQQRHQHQQRQRPLTNSRAMASELLAQQQKLFNVTVHQISPAFSLGSHSHCLEILCCRPLPQPHTCSAFQI